MIDGNLIAQGRGIARGLLPFCIGRMSPLRDIDLQQLVYPAPSRHDCPNT
ncbi:hypothetical protein [Limimaricola sp.]|nr:hypothetical protein [Limimaricola sp.]